MKKSPRSYLVLALLACGVLYWVLDLSRSGRTAIDWVVIGLVVGAIVWNLTQLGWRLYRAFGRKEVWHLVRTIGFWVIGLMNTLMIRAEEVGSWKHWVGWAVVVLALADTIALSRAERRVQSASAAGADSRE